MLGLIMCPISCLFFRKISAGTKYEKPYCCKSLCCDRKDCVICSGIACNDQQLTSFVKGSGLRIIVKSTACLFTNNLLATSSQYQVLKLDHCDIRILSIWYQVKGTLLKVLIPKCGTNTQLNR